uniref:Uncharacterized protein n=1 Tax=Tanacetum cinerariifolium TaxID=118510 RepID=A0A6L2MD68_TANCI|nr:hypothetical protein [Tanacetum cinerariifolium]
MYIEDDSDRYIAQCFVNGLYAPDGEINLEKNDNLISNNYAVKLCLEYEVRKGKKLVKKELMVSLCGEIYFVQFIINPEEEEFEPRLIFRRPSSSVGTPLTQEEAEKWALAHNISMRYEMMEEVRPVIETLAYIDKYKKLLDEIWADKVRLDGKIKPEEERAMIKVKGQMLKEKKDPGAFIFPIRLEGLSNKNTLVDTVSDINTMPYRIYEQLGRDDIMKQDRNITMINYTEAEVTGQLVNILCQVGFTTLSAKFLILEIPVDQDPPIVVGHGFLDTIGGNIDIPSRILTTFDGLSRQTFRVARSKKSESLRATHMMKNTMFPIKIEEKILKIIHQILNHAKGAYDHEVGSSRTKRSRHVETVEEALLPNVHHEFLEWGGCSIELLHKIGCGEEIDHMLKISLKEAQSNEEIFFSIACVRDFNIREPIYPELCHEFYATYEFNEVCADNDLQSKKIISFRLGGRGLRSDENFNAREYWERISTYRDLHFSRSSITSVRFSILRVLHKMSTYGLCLRMTGYEKIQKNDLWLLSMFEARHQNGYANVAWVIVKWIKRKGAGSQKDSQIYCGQFISKIARKSKVLTKEIVRTLSTLVYCKDLDMTTLRELIDSEDRLIPDILVDDVPRVATQRALRV